ncbi:DNA/RNA non-specific endonuclease [Undibacterium sp. TS12]|uniref:DNA/RNA non-specific endonuclease n=1 Tax=Undibacterium sp. TS12 TaxID=2908202 RepID=UPI001F4C9386|nr:DNA/RNA non-specific endonuclease [Undibacterium sp. TS12]MCH8620232.1 DNA/RNA non-specific endonuclease [Undibacterium sp. TS12]
MLKKLTRLSPVLVIAVLSLSFVDLSFFDFPAFNFPVRNTGDFAGCRQFFAEQKIPVLQHSTDMRPRALCFSAFAVLHSGRSHTPIYVAERLNRKIINQAKENERSNQFYADTRLPRAERAELDDYKGSGYDRGHMAPAADMADSSAMAQSFSLANMVPQAPINNRKIWANIEKATRQYVLHAQGDIYVITGPVYDLHPTTVGNNKVWVPKFLFKLVYDPGNGRTWAYWVENSDNPHVSKSISYKELVRKTGIRFLSLPESDDM